MALDCGVRVDYNHCMNEFIRQYGKSFKVCTYIDQINRRVIKWRDCSILERRLTKRITLLMSVHTNKIVGLARI